MNVHAKTISSYLEQCADLVKRLPDNVENNKYFI
jgi:hypothetical protein